MCYTFLWLTPQWVCLHQHRHDHASNACVPTDLMTREDSYDVTRRWEFLSLIISLWDHRCICSLSLNWNAVMQLMTVRCQERCLQRYEWRLGLRNLSRNLKRQATCTRMSASTGDKSKARRQACSVCLRISKDTMWLGQSRWQRKWQEWGQRRSQGSG